MDIGQIAGMIFRLEHWTSPMTLTGLGLLVFVILTAIPKPNRRSEPIGRILRRDIVIMTMLPMLSLALVLTDRSTRHLSEGTRAALEAVATGLSATLGERLEKAQAAVQSLALSVEFSPDASPAALAQLLIRYHEHNPEFISMLAARSDGAVMAATLAGDSGVVVADADQVVVADREYFRQPLRTGEPFLSSAFVGRGLGSDVIVAASAPVANPKPGAPVVVEGSIDFDRLGQVVRDYPLPESAEVVVLDPAGRVAASNHPRSFRPLSEPGPAFLEETADGGYISASRGTGNAWIVIVRLPAVSLREQIAADLVISAIWVAAGLSLALLLAAVLTARVSSPLQRLAHAVKDYVPPRSTDRIAVPSRAPQEIRMLARHFNLSARRMNEMYTRLVAMLDSREGGEKT